MFVYHFGHYKAINLHILDLKFINLSFCYILLKFNYHRPILLHITNYNLIHLNFPFLNIFFQNRI